MGRKVFVLHSALAPNAVADALRRSIDEAQWTLFSLSGYKGKLPLLGQVGETTFEVQKRKYYRNDLAGRFYGRFAPEPGGTRIEGYFDYPRWARYFMRIWLGFAVLVGTPLFVGALSDVIAGSNYVSGDKWVGLLGLRGWCCSVPCCRGSGVYSGKATSDLCWSISKTRLLRASSSPSHEDEPDCG